MPIRRPEAVMLSLGDRPNPRQRAVHRRQVAGDATAVVLGGVGQLRAGFGIPDALNPHAHGVAQTHVFRPMPPSWLPWNRMAPQKFS